jgi:SAM-dependent methyltransferase
MLVGRDLRLTESLDVPAGQRQPGRHPHLEITRRPSTTHTTTRSNDMGSSHVQGALWGIEARVWSETFEPITRPLFEQVHDELGTGGGTKLLDAGCGSGLALQIGAERGAEVAGIDAAAGMLTIARERNPDAELHEGDLEDLPWDDDRFDAVTGFNSVQYASNPVAALRELRRVTATGAPLALATWAEAERCESRVVFTAIGGLLPPPPAGAGGPFALSAPGNLEALVEQAGLKPQRADEVAVDFVFANLGDAVHAHLAAGPGRRAIEHAGREAATDALRASMESSVQPDGTSVHRNAFRYLIATA